MTGREKVLEYCEKMKSNSDFSDDVFDVMDSLKNNEFPIGYCQGNFELDNYVGVCREEIFDGNNWDEVKKKCSECWKRALESKVIENENQEEIKNIIGHYKLFKIETNNDDDDVVYLTVGNADDTIQIIIDRESEKLDKSCDCFMGCFVSEINEVDGHKIIII